ncbi:MAG: hypothetical protein AVDCRST_MAG19-3187 [uncultured Thermomicrobiales bacterium]|uniref:Uncharacterized protein n=1 Tax=uncultured Thermomicrobiales bacterium TaxID=1645740 RepID=A0A6J4VBD9_9BACT|nr:MAG: hypothetical protein AVDCRST_MAG19-3187 [uncultured Thermomicrobiales bacterium]
MTRSETRRDLARQAANVAGALFQVRMTAAAAASIRAETDQATPPDRARALRLLRLESDLRALARLRRLPGAPRPADGPAVAAYRVVHRHQLRRHRALVGLRPPRVAPRGARDAGDQRRLPQHGVPADSGGDPSPSAEPGPTVARRPPGWSLLRLADGGQPRQPPLGGRPRRSDGGGRYRRGGRLRPAPAARRRARRGRGRDRTGQPRSGLPRLRRDSPRGAGQDRRPTIRRLAPHDRCGDCRRRHTTPPVAA